MTLRRFNQEKKNEFRALQIWQILISTAYNRQIITYGMLAEMLGYKGASVLGQPLGHIAFFCNQHGLPPLTSLVVNEKTGLPGENIPVEDAAAKRENVFNYAWFAVIPPSPLEFKEAFTLGMKGQS